MCDETVTVKKIVAGWLRENDYDGLWDGEDCGCADDDLFNCDSPSDRCQPGYRIPCTCGGGCVYHIGPEKLKEIPDETDA